MNDQLLANVMKYSSFDYMKDRFDVERRLFEATTIDAIDDKQTADQQRELFMNEENLKTVRKGEINDWKSFMTREQCARIDARFRQTCIDCDDLINYWSQWTDD
jgi:hypothetical protein